MERHGRFTLRAKRAAVDGVAISNCYVTIHNGVIEAVSQNAPPGSSVIDLGHVDLIPGLVDLHSDALNPRSQPRPRTRFPLGATLLQVDAEAVANGVTTQCLCLTVDDDLQTSNDIVDPTDWLTTLQLHKKHLRTDSMLHVRFELSAERWRLSEHLADPALTKLVSYMNHAPGVGQYSRDSSAWDEAFLRSHDGGPEDRKRISNARALRARDVSSRRRETAMFAADAGIPLASHDDLTRQDAMEAARVGASICEFPLTLEAAVEARRTGIHVVMGAPNAWRGSSHLSWLSARDAISEGVVSALVSDYHPASLIHAVYSLAEAGDVPWAAAVRLVTEGPAVVGGFHDRGRIAKGFAADLAAVDSSAGLPIVKQTWRSGRPLMGICTE
ncbi:phosphonate metabolism protein PhnM [Mycolicibacterium mageritense DSM 44476 = CIP 104973]|uniref:Phosphonate metabolism protein PhnM n=1 Tax=Mycolicibacterium mageritense TaxID=53462 RepID=A0ABM7HPA9_MYCME|nr:alpha-D-ribose 1-methylphosphonate 5-triphosphate diphosphatase [Mycolicibacterium mageritense]MCC9180605.1 alpha-D-ribose 1-methylphosphonate 5-triphosphate diphosphatase [Mycolicibacterium mageritense]TXH17139.1 MAG: alpha-D-ribose 1-methylphosphonate 5-triphosphate diphosphatase [Mycobacterium sp.]BBX32355.1 phosphonate metabolism protein PhnM [Mycolicibacterium mageritense]CDO23103.1 Alpha-D-ribose 1-methylphosphonate 5-triphosphate diphosphatase [Mycolicibacterium mageritense DSM 44476 